MTYRVAIDTSLCCGYGRCVRVAPNTFTLENGLAVLRGLETSDGSVVEAARVPPGRHHGRGGTRLRRVIMGRYSRLRGDRP